MKGFAFVALFVLLTSGGCGCKTIVSIGVHKDWAVNGHPLNSSVYKPDMKTSAELRFEKDWK